MSDALADLLAIARHLQARGHQTSMLGGDKVSVRAKVVDFWASASIQFRPSRIVRISIGLPVKVAPAQRELFAVALLELNQRGLGAGVVMTGHGLGVVTQVPVDAEGRVPAAPLERALALAIDVAREALPVLERTGATGLASV